MSRMRLSLMQRLSFLIRVFGIGCSGRCLPRRICGLRRALLHAVLFGQRLLATTLVDALLQQIACAQPQANGFLVQRERLVKRKIVVAYRIDDLSQTPFDRFERLVRLVRHERTRLQHERLRRVVAARRGSLGVDVFGNAAQNAVHETRGLVFAAEVLRQLNGLVDGDAGGNVFHE